MQLLVKLKLPEKRYSIMSINVKDILIRIGYVIHFESATHYHMCPLYRESDNNLALEVDKKSGLWYDFVKKEGGSLYKLVALTIGLKTRKEVETFLQLEGGHIDTGVQHRYELDEIKKFDKGMLVKLNKDHSYWLKRGISTKTVETFEGGTTYNGRMKNRYVFPIFNEKDELVGFSGRILYQDSIAPKWKHIGSKSNWCYPLKWNKELLSRLQEVVLVESIGDMLSLWNAGVQNTIVTFGISISNSIIEFLLKIDAQRILLAFNNDEDNNLVGNDAAEKELLHLTHYFDREQIVLALPDYKDFGEMDSNQINLWTTKFNVKTP